MDDPIVLLEDLATFGWIKIFNDRYIDFRVELHDEESNLVWKTNGRNLDEALEKLHDLIGDHYDQK